MAVPKRRTSRSNTRSRRARWKATPPDLVPVIIAGRRHLVPRRLVRAYQPPSFTGVDDTPGVISG